MKFEMLPPNLHIFVYNLKIRIGVWAKEPLGDVVVTPHDLIHNLDVVLL